jgi:hypothetical protein
MEPQGESAVSRREATEMYEQLAEQYVGKRREERSELR